MPKQETRFGLNVWTLGKIEDVLVVPFCRVISLRVDLREFVPGVAVPILLRAINLRWAPTLQMETFRMVLWKFPDFCDLVDLPIDDMLEHAADFMKPPLSPAQAKIRLPVSIRSPELCRSVLQMLRDS